MVDTVPTVADGTTRHRNNYGVFGVRFGRFGRHEKYVGRLGVKRNFGSFAFSFTATSKVQRMHFLRHKSAIRAFKPYYLRSLILDGSVI